MKKRINLLYVIYSLDNGGAETLAIRLSEKIDKERFNPIVCSLSDRGPLREILVKYGITYYTLGKKEGKDFSVVFKIADILKKEKIDIIHTHNQGPLLYVFIAKLFFRRIKHVHTEHINMGVELSYSKKHELYNVILLRSLDGVINIAQHLNSQSAKYIKKKNAKVETILNSVEPATYDFSIQSDLKHELGLDAGSFLIGNISALRPQKDHATLLNAMPYILKENPHAVLVIAGDGELRNDLEEQCLRMGLTENVTFLGYRADVNNLLAQFDVFVLSSLYEGLPLCILEAMAAGKPIVATDAAGTNELVRDSETGLLVPVGDAEQLGKSISLLLEHPERAAEMGRKAKELVNSEHNMDTMMKKYESYYLRLVADNKQISE
ncbi:glycosyltransferase [Desulfogranum japonicum]|uniref:glycosyltransferase n=1 Tax=Desulfogranum japonicum TaxID=231447 RepID=UPI00048D57C3|nr:glycosyltransferase [Desulfogranum japonicum]